MRKSVWMSQLERALAREGVAGSEKRTVLKYYEEMYQDKLEDGLTEEEIVREFGFPEDVARNVRENDGRERAKFGTSDRETFRDRGGYEDRRYEDRRYENRRYEERGYDEPRYNNRYDGYQGGAVPPRGGEYAGGGQYPPPPPPRETPRNRGGGCFTALFSLIGAFVRILLIIVLGATGLGLAVGGCGAIVGGFAVITFNAGAWLAAFGVGLILFAVGCLIVSAAVKVAKGFAEKGGAR